MFSLIPAFHYGWKEMHKKLWIFLSLTILFSFVDIVGSILLRDANIDEILQMGNALELIPSNLILWIGLLMLVMICVNFFVISLVLAGLRGVPPMEYLHMKIKRFPAYLAAMILKYLVIGIGITLFVIPGLFLLLALYFTEYLIIDREMSLGDAFKSSWAMTKGFRMGIFFFEVNVFVISYLLSFPQSIWPNTVLTFAILALINVVWLPVVWNAAGWIYQFVSHEQLRKNI